MESRGGHDRQRVRIAGDDNLIKVVGEPQARRRCPVYARLQTSLVEPRSQGLLERDENTALRMSAQVPVNRVLRTGGYTKPVDGRIEPVQSTLLQTGSHEY